MISEETKKQAKKALNDLEDAILKSLNDLQNTETTSTRTRDIAFNLDLATSIDLGNSKSVGSDLSTSAIVNIVKSVLNKLKVDGRVENITKDAADAWQLPTQKS